MKLKKFLGHLLTVLGSVVLLIGIVAAILPNVTNRQMKLIVTSFQTPSDNWLIQSMNNGFTFAMNHVFLMILLGLVIIAAGILLMISARTDAQLQAQSTSRPANAGVAATATAAAVTATAVAAQPTKATARQQEENPFARYLKGDEVPKSTPAPSGELADDTGPATPAQNEELQNSDDTLVVWEDFQQPPASDALYIQPVHLINDEAYRRPEKNKHSDLQLPDAEKPEEAAPEQAVSEAPVAEAETEPAAEVAPMEEQPAQPEQPAPERPRPLIRSTFRKVPPLPAAQPAVAETAPDPIEAVSAEPVETPVQEVDMPAELAQPLMETVDETMKAEPVETLAPSAQPVAETPETPVAETIVEAPAAQPVPRIKSTMGRKR